MLTMSLLQLLQTESVAIVDQGLEYVCYVRYSYDSSNVAPRVYKRENPFLILSLSFSNFFSLYAIVATIAALASIGNHRNMPQLWYSMDSTTTEDLSWIRS